MTRAMPMEMAARISRMVVMVLVIVRAWSTVSDHALFARLPEGLQFLVQCGHGGLVLELKGEPGGFGPGPFRRQAFEDFSGGRLKTPARPEGRRFLRPQPQHAVMGGDGLDAFPEQFPRGVGHGKVLIPLAVEPGVRTGDLQADGAGHISGGGFHHLKFGQPLFQLFRRETHGMPQRLQAAKIVGRGAADAKARRIHRRFYTKSAGFMATPAAIPPDSNPTLPGRG